MTIQADILVAGSASAPLMRLTAPLSFWGGVDPQTGQIVDRQNDGFGERVAGRILALGALRGSSSSSAVLLELIHRKLAPAALIIADADAILIAGLLSAREMGWTYPPLLRLAVTQQAMLPDATINVHPDGHLTWSA